MRRLFYVVTLLIWLCSTGRSQSYNWPPLSRVNVTLTQSDLLALNTTPRTLIHGASGKTIVVVYATFRRHFPVWYSNNVGLYINYEGPAGACLGIGAPDDPTFDEGQNPDAIFPCPAGFYMNFNFWGGYIAPRPGDGVAVLTDAGLIGGGVGNTLTIDLFYYVQ